MNDGASERDFYSQITPDVAAVIRKFSRDIGVPPCWGSYEKQIRFRNALPSAECHENILVTFSDPPGNVDDVLKSFATLRFRRWARDGIPHWDILAVNRENSKEDSVGVYTHEIMPEHVAAVIAIRDKIRANAKAAQS